MTFVLMSVMCQNEHKRKRSHVADSLHFANLVQRAPVCFSFPNLPASVEHVAKKFDRAFSVDLLLLLEQV